MGAAGRRRDARAGGLAAEQPGASAGLAAGEAWRTAVEPDLAAGVRLGAQRVRRGQI